MGKYRKKPVVIEAMEFPDNGPEQHDVVTWVRDNGGDIELIDGVVENDVNTSTDANWRWRCGFIKTLVRNHIFNIGDYIIKDVNGEFYACKPDIFEKTHEKVKENK